MSALEVDMRKLLSTVLLFLMSFPVLAAVGEEGGASAPAPTVDMIYVVIFGVIFVGMIVGFFVYLYTKKDDTDQK
jgi:hypothetical protein